MRATKVIRRLAQLIQVYGDCDITIGSSKKDAVVSIVEDSKETLVSAGEVESKRVFTFVEEE